MRPLQAHCHRGLGTLYAKIGRPEQASAALSTAIEMYQTMEMTFWLPEIAVKFSIRPEVADQWLARVAPFTAATRAEPGNLFFEWSRSTDRPNQFVLLEAFRNREAGEAHVRSAHFQAAMAWMPDAVAATPDSIHVEAPGDGWSPMAELQPRTAP